MTPKFISASFLEHPNAIRMKIKLSIVAFMYSSVFFSDSGDSVLFGNISSKFY